MQTGMNRGFVASVTNFVDEFLLCGNAGIHLWPYFEGDYWIGLAETMIEVFSHLIVASLNFSYISRMLFVGWKVFAPCALESALISKLVPAFDFKVLCSLFEMLWQILRDLPLILVLQCPADHLSDFSTTRVDKFLKPFNLKIVRAVG